MERLNDQENVVTEAVELPKDHEKGDVEPPKIQVVVEPSSYTEPFAEAKEKAAVELLSQSFSLTPQVTFAL